MGTKTETTGCAPISVPLSLTATETPGFRWQGAVGINAVIPSQPGAKRGRVSSGRRVRPAGGVTGPEGLPSPAPFVLLPGGCALWWGRLQSSAWQTLRALGTGSGRSPVPKVTAEQVCRARPPTSEFRARKKETSMISVSAILAFSPFVAKYNPRRFSFWLFFSLTLMALLASLYLPAQERRRLGCGVRAWV